jgi:hypothetical protein
MRRPFCWVQGEDPARRFDISITSTETVSALREMIKKKTKPDFNDVRADSLKLWKVRAQLCREKYC